MVPILIRINVRHTMKQRDIIVANTLTYSGTLPLIGSVILLQFPTLLPMAGLDAALIASTYSAVIISFLSGIHWAAYLFFADRCPRHLLIRSNVVALLAWVSLLTGNQLTTSLLQILCFLYLLALDSKLRDAALLAEWFFRLRRNATLIVVSCLLLIVVVV
ncbi:MAG: DUF3429 domain-containing protein [Pseudohongiella sp.]|nr:DUF3429 domain-containing protein [Pseudohongiella sp.]